MRRSMGAGFRLLMFVTVGLSIPANPSISLAQQPNGDRELFRRIDALSQSYDSDATQELIRLGKEKPGESRIWVMRALLRRNAKIAVPWLCAVLGETTSSEEQAEAAKTLGWLGDARAVPHLTQSLRRLLDAEMDSRAAVVVEALQRLRRDDAIAEAASPAARQKVEVLRRIVRQIHSTTTSPWEPQADALLLIGQATRLVKQPGAARVVEDLISDSSMEWRVRWAVLTAIRDWEFIGGGYNVHMWLYSLAPKFVAIFTDKHAAIAVRTISIWLLGEIRGRPAPHGVAAVLRDASELDEVKGMAMSYLGRAGCDDIDLMLDIARHSTVVGSPDVIAQSQSAILAIGGSGHPRALSALLDIAHASTTTLAQRWSVLSALDLLQGEHNQGSKGFQDAHEAIPWVMDVLERDNHPSSRSLAARFLGDFYLEARVVPPLIKALDDPDSIVVAAAAHALQSVRALGAAPMLKRILDNFSSDGRFTKSPPHVRDYIQSAYDSLIPPPAPAANNQLEKRPVSPESASGWAFTVAPLAASTPAVDDVPPRIFAFGVEPDSPMAGEPCVIRWVGEDNATPTSRLLSAALIDVPFEEWTDTMAAFTTGRRLGLKSLSAGTHVVYVVMSDENGNLASSSYSFVVSGGVSPAPNPTEKKRRR